MRYRFNQKSNPKSKIRWKKDANSYLNVLAIHKRQRKIAKENSDGG